MDSDNDRTVVRTSRRPSAMPPDGMGGPLGMNTLPIGTRLGEFEILNLIGEGGFGIVYLAYDHSLDRQVALKEYMPSGLAARTQAMHVTVRSRHYEDTFVTGLRSFINEARLLARFDSPSLVKVYRFWEENGTAYMVMPFYEGLTLKQALKERKIEPDEEWIRALLANMFDALETIHREQCFHRDVAPDNILLLRDGRPVLLDFGAARRVIGDLTQGPTVILKPGFAPIEQYADIPGLRQGAWTDIYALGAVVYYLITGKAPSPAVSRVVHDDMVPAREVGRGRFSDGFLAVIDHALAVKPEHRLQSVAEMRRALGLEGVGAHTLPAGHGVATPEAIAAVRGSSSRSDDRTLPHSGVRNSRYGGMARDEDDDWKKTLVADKRPMPAEQKRSKTGLVVSVLVLCASAGIGVAGYQWLNQPATEETVVDAAEERAESPQAALPAPTPSPSSSSASSGGFGSSGSSVSSGSSDSASPSAGSGTIASAPAPAPAESRPVPDIPPTPVAPQAAAPEAPPPSSTLAAPNASATPAPAPAPSAQTANDKLALASPSPTPAAPAQSTPPAPAAPTVSPEDDLYRAAASKDTVEAYKSFLKRYPRGKHSAAVKLMLENKQAELAEARKEAAAASASAQASTDRIKPDASASTSAAVKEDKGSVSTSSGSTPSTTTPSLAAKNPSIDNEQQSKTNASPAASPTSTPATSQTASASGLSSTPSNANSGSSTSPVPPLAKAAPTQEAVKSEPPKDTTPRVEPAKPEAPRMEESKIDTTPPAATGPQRTLSFPGQTMVGNFTPDPVSGLVSGTGQIRWDNGDRFEGRLVKGIKEGKGKFVWASGQQYSGDWSGDKPNGKGVLQFSNGNRYEGDIKDGQPHGKGTTKFRNGDVYTGSWVNGVSEGRGVFQFASGDRYEGEVKNGVPNGQGTTKFRSGDVYTGNWVKGRHHGHGRYTWQSGSYWEGEFKDGVKTENGQLVRADSSTNTSAPAANAAEGGNTGGTGMPVAETSGK